MKSRLAQLQTLEEHIADFFVQMKENSQTFTAIFQEHDGLMQLVGFLHEKYPSLIFDAHLIAELAKFNLSMDFDFYALLSDAREDL